LESGSDVVHGVHQKPGKGRLRLEKRPIKQ
jgi:hypothetical protein